MYAVAAISPINFAKYLRILLLAALLTVGSLQVTRCSNDEDAGDAARDQYDRMYRVVLSVNP